jgi:uncharacterized protein
MEAYYYLISAHNSDNNSPEPLYHLGFLYEYGLGVSLDSFTAIKYYEMAAKLNHGKSLNKLGDIYFSGFGVERDF